MSNIELIEDYFEELYKNPKCELDYKKDYELLIAVMLSAQTTDKRVNKVTKVLFNKYNNLYELKNANIADLKNILRELGSFNKKAIYTKEIASIICDKYNGKMPYNRKELESLPGVGRKTVNVVFSELNFMPNIAVDTHVERVSKRLGLAKKDDNVLEIEKKLKRKYKRENWNKRHLQMVLFGRYNCKAVKPDCDNCKLKEICKYYKNNRRTNELHGK